ncbi:hypothetical protein GUITHDRAFT_122124 [Guillardia theta CCMP2712]|uniref:Uncharacterized protein n=1 Tax=Guillardia theta (strain CCMP2712) TaxID=905079 RepID=L1I731_GUITC|nr:hypothetical protein GUITHDRAFT_122124 [Guillardia theta CCMP2712]EKX31684.1 hypothetical protein GUITHDRAFT_122124 [Guillardia theta CCMP2712]|eukprot:XP_005818664.1 hypothetical protein GUITHDRAFT_122124 [Guillardia theta CCMP2712]
MFVPVITWGTEDSLLDELTMLSNERDKESSFLASVLAAFYLLNKGIGRLKAIVPILRDESCGRVSITEVCRNLSKTSSLINCHKASLLLLEGGVRKDQSMIVEYLASFSVQEVILSLLPVHWRVAAGLKTSDMGVSKDIQGGHSMFMMGENDIKTSAYEAGQAVTTILLELMDVYVRRKMWEFSSHNFRGIELLQMFKEAGVDDVFFENFALKSFDSFVRLNSSRSWDEQYQRNVDTLNMLVERFKDDERLLPLDTRLRRYRDTEVDGILALRTTNSLETAQLKLPAQRGIFCLLCVQLTFALNQIKLTVNLDLVWMRDPVCVIATPKIVSVPSLLNVVLGFLWCFLLGTAVVVDKFGTPFQRKRVMINTIISILVGYILTFLVDIVQCSIYTGKLDRCCQGFHVFVTIAFVILFLYFAQYKQQYVWIAVFFIQGAYCIFQGLKEDDWTSYIFYFLGSICIVISCWVLIVYRINYRKTLKKLELEMLSFQGTWNQLVEGKAEVLRTLDERVGEIQAELKSKIAQRVESPLQQLVEMLELRRTRYSTRMHKITQQCQDLQQLYLEAQQVSADFQQLIATWTPVGFVWEGKLKSVARAIQKTVRSYGRDASCLTDIVRCTVVVDSIDDVLTWVEGLKRNSMVAHGIATPKNLKRRISTDARIEMDRDDFLEKKFMSITSIKNR